jgi:hypothetical protein
LSRGLLSDLASGFCQQHLADLVVHSSSSWIAIAHGTQSLRTPCILHLREKEVPPFVEIKPLATSVASS